MSTTLAVLGSAHMSLPVFFAQPQAWKNKVLGTICFSSSPSLSIEMTQLPFVQVPTPMLQGTEAACEVWLSDNAIIQGHDGTICYRHDEQTLFGVIVVAEVGHADSGSTASPLQRAAESAYRQIFALLDKMGYAFMYRFWNYMADINQVSHGLERYRQFNVGRQNAFLACGRDVTGQLPAACALGVMQGPLTISFLAGRMSSRAIENPRQLSAYQYPQQYGPRSPVFSRANLLLQPDAEILLISGTASIVGHETLHHADVIAQTQESLINIQAIVSEANRLLNKQAFDLARVFYRIYVRHAADMPLIRQELLRTIGADMKATFVQADICRADLLLEIEATAMAVDGFAA